MCFDLYDVNSDFGGILPADFDGETRLLQVPSTFTEWDDSSWLTPPDPIDVARWVKFHVDWTTPANSTFGLSGLPNYLIPTVNIDPNMCGYVPVLNQALQAKVDAISDRLMYRLQYRNFGSYQTLVSNHTVNASGTDIAGVYWFELRNNGRLGNEPTSVFYSPDSNNRWMGSAALDHVGNFLALGYSVSSSTVSSVRYVGRFSRRPSGTVIAG